MIEKHNEESGGITPDLRVSLRQGEANLFTLRVENPDMTESFVFTVKIEDELTNLQNSAALGLEEQIRLLTDLKEIEYWDQLGFFDRMDFKLTNKALLNLIDSTNIRPKLPKNSFFMPKG